LLAAIAASAVALFVVSRAEMHVWQALAGSVVMGGGIAAMHYIGMAAMRCAAVIFLRHRTRCSLGRTGDRDLIRCVEARFPGAG